MATDRPAPHSSTCVGSDIDAGGAEHDYCSQDCLAVFAEPIERRAPFQSGYLAGKLIEMDDGWLFAVGGHDRDADGGDLA